MLTEAGCAADAAGETPPQSAGAAKPLYKMPRRGPLVSGTVLSRPNRFVASALVDGQEAKCYLPNPGRLWELIYPGAELLLTPSFASTDYTVLGVRRENGETVPLHTHRANDLAAAIVRAGLLPGHEKALVKRREIPVGDSRFDLLLSEDARDLYVEVKCCTLFAGGGAYFPDAPSDRACRHVRHLARMAGEGVKTAVLVIVNSPAPRWFLPDWHTDPDFARAMLEARGRVEFIPLALGWNADMVAEGPVRRLSVPWRTLEREMGERGLCLALIEREGEFWCSLERSSELTKAMARWSRARKAPEGRAEELRAGGRLLAAVPFRTPEDVFDALGEDLDAILARPCVPDGSRRLGRFAGDPRRWQPFVQLLLKYRFTRLDPVIGRELDQDEKNCLRAASR